MWLLLLIATLHTSIYSQDQRVADSLISVLKSGNFPDSLEYDILEDITFNHSNPEIKLDYANIIIEKATKENFNYKKYVGYYTKGSAQRLMGDLDAAGTAYFESSKYAKLAQDQEGVGKAFAALGDVYANNDDFKNALSYYNQAIEILRITNDSIALASTLLNTGYKYYLSESYDSSLIYYEESGAIFKNLNYELGIAYNIGNSGLTFAKQNKLSDAQAKMEEAISILLKYQDPYAITEFEIELAKIFNDNGQYQIALRYAKDAESLAAENGLKKRLRDVSILLSGLYQATGEYQKAYTYQSQYIAYRDSINNEETIRKMADLRTEYEVGQKQAEVDLANTEKEAQAKIALLVGAGLVVFLLLIGVIALIQYRNNQQKKATNQVLRSQKAQLESLNTTKDRFFSIISHDLRGPVNAFFGVSKLIKMYVSKGKVNEINEIAEDIDESVSKLSGLLDNLLDWAVQQQGQFPNVPEKINFNDMTNDLIQVFDTMAKSKSIKLVNSLPDNLTLFVDKNSTMTIFRNLLNNALKFTEEGGSVTFHGELSKENAILKVTDTGVGIPPDKLKKLFTLNEKKSTWGTAGEKGLGLGLQLAYEFAEMNKGAIEVESEEGVGTSFTVKLPVFETEDVKSSS